MLTKPSSCVGCPLYGDGVGFVPDEIVEGAEVLVLAQNPGEDEERGRRATRLMGRAVEYERCTPAPLLGKTGHEMARGFWPFAGLERGKVSLANVLRCRWQRGGERTNDLPPAAVLYPAVAHCMAAHMRAPAATRLVVASGALAWSVVAPGVGSVTEWRGYLAPEDGDGVGDIRGVGRGDPSGMVRRLVALPRLATLHVADLFHDPRMRIPTRSDWARVPRFLKGVWPVEHPGARVNPPADSLDALRTAPYVAIDTEYYTETKELRVLGVGAPGTPILQWTAALPEVGSALRDLIARVPVVFQNAMADTSVLREAFGLEWDDYKRVDDTMQAHAVLWSEWPHDLGFLASLYSPYAKRKHLAASDLLTYNAGDVADTVAVWEALARELEKDPATKAIYETQNLPLLPVVERRQQEGIRVNIARVGPASADYLGRIEAMRRMAQAAVGWPINLGSPKQLQHWLYTVVGYPVQKAKRTRRPTVDDDAITALRQRSEPLPDLDTEAGEPLTPSEAFRRSLEGADPLLEARVAYAHALQAESHYIRPCMGVARIYPSFAIHAQASGRWSITDPPLQQFPPDLRDLVVPDEGCVWIEWDWDQAELRLIAALANDTPLLAIFSNAWDVHTMNACDVFGLPYPPDRRDPHKAEANAAWREAHHWTGKEDTRRVFAKRFVYRLNYGGDPRTAGDIPGARTLGLDGPALVRASRRFLAAHPALAAWRRRVEAEASTTRESRTFLGRRRRLLGRGKELIRQAFDHPMQGGVSDVANTTVVTIARERPAWGLIHTRHDSQCWQVPAVEEQTALAYLRGVAERTWNVGGVALAIPATFKVTRP